MTALSVLDLAPIPEGGSAALALHNSLSLAQNAEACGYPATGWPNTTT
jgi:hypothetical protein